MKRQCPDSECLSQNLSPKKGFIVRKGSYFRRSDGQRIRRYRCLVCARNFSSATFSSCYRQKKRKLNHAIYLLLSSGVTQRRAARILRTNRKTVVRKVRFLARTAEMEHTLWLKKISKQPVRFVQFDDLETSEHTKCKPLSVALAVEP